ncbi:MAG: hypothetical protein M3443_16850 [Actinomycetota bacterium]|nr:hypothetical protein [Actinomycetota bacterium]
MSTVTPTSASPVPRASFDALAIAAVLHATDALPPLRPLGAIAARPLAVFGRSAGGSPSIGRG